MPFIESFCTFLRDNNFQFYVEGSAVVVTSNNVVFLLVSTNNSQPFVIPQIDAISSIKATREYYKAIPIYQDRWVYQRSMMEGRVLAHLGFFRSVFARKCAITRIDAETARTFLEKHHSYGYARCRYKYGMLHEGELVAVSLFSSPRVMTWGERPIKSYEWIRYASCSDMRIAGGMSKMLKAFIRDIQPEEVMTYADLEWSDGEAYRKMGFTEAGRRDSITFWVDPNTFERKRTPSGIEICNLGSIKYTLRITR